MRCVAGAVPSSTAAVPMSGVSVATMIFSLGAGLPVWGQAASGRVSGHHSVDGIWVPNRRASTGLLSGSRDGPFGEDRGPGRRGHAAVMRRTSISSRPSASASARTPYRAARSATMPVSTVSPPSARAFQGRESRAERLAQVPADADLVPLRPGTVVRTRHWRTAQEASCSSAGAAAMTILVIAPPVCRLWL